MFTPILHVSYGLGIWRCPWQSGSQFPPSFDVTWMLNCCKITFKNLIQCMEKKNQNNPLQWIFAGTRLGHKMNTDSESRSAPTAWFHCFLEQPDASWETYLAEGSGKREWGRSLGKLSNRRNWSIWHAEDRSNSETCSFWVIQRKIQNKTT